MKKPFTVEELIEALKKLPPDREVFMSRDAEGNAYRQFDGFSSKVSVKDHRNDGIESDQKYVVVLWPAH